MFGCGHKHTNEHSAGVTTQPMYYVAVLVCSCFASLRLFILYLSIRWFSVILTDDIDRLHHVTIMGVNTFDIKISM